MMMIIPDVADEDDDMRESLLRLRAPGFVGKARDISISAHKDVGSLL